MYYGCSQKLTEQEKKYLEHFWFKKGSHLRFSVYFCEGISEPVSPISEKLYKLAEEGDDVTVVMVERENIFLGITFHEKYDEKVGVK